MALSAPRARTRPRSRVGIPGSETEHSWTFGCNQDRDRSIRSRKQLGVAQLVEATVEGHRFAAQERLDDAEGLLETADAVVGWIVERLESERPEGQSTPAEQSAVVARIGNEGWSLYGASCLQLMAISGKSRPRESQK